MLREGTRRRAHARITLRCVPLEVRCGGRKRRTEGGKREVMSGRKQRPRRYRKLDDGGREFNRTAPDGALGSTRTTPSFTSPSSHANAACTGIMHPGSPSCSPSAHRRRSPRDRSIQLARPAAYLSTSIPPRRRRRPSLPRPSPAAPPSELVYPAHAHAHARQSPKADPILGNDAAVQCPSATLLARARPLRGPRESITGGCSLHVIHRGLQIAIMHPRRSSVLSPRHPSTSW